MRYLPLTASDRVEMLAAIGVESVDALFEDVPPAARLSGPVDLPRAMGEIEVEGLVSRMAARNVAAGSVPFFIGGGVYRHHVPAAVDHLIQRGEFLTSYTPYQPEISQGTLQYLFEFQTQVALLTGMEVANASLYDGATACAEAVMMANRVTGRRKAVLSGGLHPHYREVCETYGRFVGFELSVQDLSADEDLGRLVDRDTSCVVVQNPDFFGEVRDYSGLAQSCHDAGALLVVVVTEILSLGAIRAARRDGRGYRRGRGPIARQCSQFRRAACRAVRHPRQVRASDAGAPRRADGRRRWPAGLGPDPVDPRAAHSARTGDQQHLHQFGIVRARFHNSSGAAWGSGADAARAPQSCRGGLARRAARAGAGDAPPEPRLLQ